MDHSRISGADLPREARPVSYNTAAPPEKKAQVAEPVKNTATYHELKPTPAVTAGELRKK